MQTAHTFESPISKHNLLNYWLYLPPNYDPSSSDRWPLLVFLHGFGERGDSLDDLERVKLHGPPQLLESGNELPFIVVSPQCSRQSWWTLYTDTLAEWVQHLITRYPIDPTRVYLTGLSMGGFGSWSLSIAYPDLFAAVAPVCGGGVASLAARLKDVPVWAFHGALDDVVSSSRSEAMVDVLRRAGADVRFTLYPDANHNSWTVTYDNPELYEWFLSHHKPR